MVSDLTRPIIGIENRTAQEGQQEAVATVAKVNAAGTSWNTVYPADALDKLPVGTSLYTRPAEQAVTEAMVEAAARAIANAWGETWECCCTEKRGLDCDCGDAMVEERDGYDERLSRDDCRMAARAALKAAMEAGHHE